MIVGTLIAAAISNILPIDLSGNIGNETLTVTFKGDFVTPTSPYKPYSPGENPAPLPSLARRALAENLAATSPPCNWRFLTDNPMVGDEFVCATGTPADPASPGATAWQPLPIVLTISDLQSMAIDPGQMGVQPPVDTVLINIETIVYTTAATQIENRIIAGTPVALRAEPINFHWDFGDGFSFDTTKKGAPYPDHYLWHSYPAPTAEDETRTITLTTTWGGAYSVDGGQWQQIDGTATTTQTSHEFRVVELRSRLTG